MATTRGSGPSPHATETRGIRVDGRCWSVDFLETLLTFGQLPRILQACIDAAELRPGDRLLDVGCGAGRLLIAAARQLQPSGLEAVGVDATPGMIDRARQRAAAAGVTVRFDVAIAEALPFEDGGFDAVTSTFFMHHLPSEAKREAIREMWRVLKPGGRLVVLDYGEPRGVRGYAASFPMRFNYYEHVRPQLRGELGRLLVTEGLPPAETLRRFAGYIQLMRTIKPADATRPRPMGLND